MKRQTNFKLLLFISSLVSYICINVLFLIDIITATYNESIPNYWIAYAFSVLGFIFYCLGFSNKYKKRMVAKIIDIASKLEGLAENIDYGNYPEGQYRVFDYTNLFLYLVCFSTIFIALIVFKFSV